MMIITLQHGLSTYAPCALVLFGIVLCIYFEEKKDMKKYKNKALELLNGSTDTYQVVYVNLIIYCNMSYWFEHVSLSVDPLRKTYKTARRSGAYSGVVPYFYHSFLSGNDLSNLSEEMGEKKKELPVKYLQISSIYTVVRIFRDALPTDAILTIETSIIVGEKQKFGHSCSCILVAYYFHEYDAAARLVEKWRIPSKDFYVGSIHYQNFVFYCGLVAVSMVKGKRNSSHWLPIANESMSLLRLWSDIVAENFKHKLTLLEAEIASIVGNHDEAMELYKEAIRLSQKYCYINEEALANERALVFSLENKAMGSAKGFFDRAIGLYEKWGAIGKVKQMKFLYSSHFDNVDDKASSQII